MNQRVLSGAVCLAALLLSAGCSSPPSLVDGTAVSMDPVSRGEAIPWGKHAVSVVIDGVRGEPGPRAIAVAGAATLAPEVSFVLHESLGTFRSAVITIRAVRDNEIDADGIFISDFAAEAKHRIAPGRLFSLLNPGPGVIVGQGDRTDIEFLEPDTVYQIDLLIQSDGGSKTVPIRFRTRA